MDFDDSPAAADFRARARAFLASHLSLRDGSEQKEDVGTADLEALGPADVWLGAPTRSCATSWPSA